MMSFAILTFEISLTRIFSVMFAYHYAFLAISLTFAGLGLGGISAQLLFTNASKREMFTGLAVVYLLFALATSFSTIISVSSTAPNFIAVAFLFFLSFLPAGAFLATAYRFFADYSNVLYGADIVGASLGAIGIITFFSDFSPIIIILLLCSILSITSLSIAFYVKKKSILVITLLIFALISSMLFFTVSYSKDVPIGADQGKELYELIKNPNLGTRIVESKWSAFGRTDLVELQNNPHYKIIFIDGGAGTMMYHFNGNSSDANSEVYELRFSTAAFPLYFAKKENLLIIGPGGGKDVLIALMFNFSHVHAVEINPETVNLVRKHSYFNGGIYTNYSNVHVHVDEGRSFLKRSSMKYDSIMLVIPITKTLQGTTGYSMAENYLFTTGSFKDYLSRLNDSGFLVVVAHERGEIYKLVTTAIKALESEGKNVKEAMRQLVVTENMQHHMTFPVLILKKTAFTPEESIEMFKKSEEIGFNPVYFPYSNPVSKQRLDPILVALENGETDLGTLIDLASRNQVDITPPTDDRPFFYKFEGSLPSTLTSLLAGFVALAITITITYLLNWGRRFNKALKKERQLLMEKFSVFMPYFFGSLGIGFMLIEVGFIQKFIMFLGSPTLAISVVLFSLLLSMGVGGIFSKKVKDATSLVLKASLLIGVVTILYIFILPSLTDAFLGLDLSIRLVISFGLTFPLGFLLGVPFPTGIRIMSQRFYGDDIAWMWGLNGLYSLVGSTLAVVIAMLWGFNIVLVMGASLYLLVSFIGRFSF